MIEKSIYIRSYTKNIKNSYSLLMRYIISNDKIVKIVDFFKIKLYSNENDSQTLQFP